MDKPSLRPGFRLTSPVCLHNRSGQKLLLPVGTLLPLVRVYQPTNRFNRRLPFLVFHEFCGGFRLGHGHEPIYFNEETQEFEYVTA
jgi:hypothetical protein